MKDMRAMRKTSGGMRVSRSLDLAAAFGGG